MTIAIPWPVPAKAVAGLDPGPHTGAYRVTSGPRVVPGGERPTAKEAKCPIST
jgi:hypothetical protein